MQKFLFLLFLISILFNQLRGEEPPVNVQSSVEETFDYVSKAQNKLELPQNDNLISVFGITGVGESTLVHYVAGAYSKLESIEPQGRGIEYIISDGLDIENV